jgi:hypothetical protein
LLYLELNSTNVIDFQGNERFPGLKRLEVHYCLKLESDAGIAALKDSPEVAVFLASDGAGFFRGEASN